MPIYESKLVNLIFGVSKMKKISLGFITLFMIIFGFTGCQPAVPTSQLVYSEIVQHNKSKDEAFELSKIWLANTFNDSKAVIEYTNKKDGTIIGKGIIPNVNYGMMNIADTRFTLKIDVKDKKSRLTFQNMVIIPNPSTGVKKYNMWNTDQLQHFNIRAKKLVADYKQSINGLKTNNNSNW